MLSLTILTTDSETNEINPPPPPHTHIHTHIPTHIIRLKHLPIHLREYGREHVLQQGQRCGRL